MTQASSDSWVFIPRPNPQARLRLFCLPYAGGGAAVFRLWPEELPADIEVGLIQLPGRERRMMEPAYSRIELLIEALAPALLPALDRPFALFGHSMGALIAFELVRALRHQHDLSPVRLFASALRAPQRPDPRDPIHQLAEPAFLARLRTFNGTPEAVLGNSELLRLFIPLLRADFALCETYRYTPDDPLDCPISVFGGDHDPEVRREDLAAWRNQTSGSFTLRMLPGDHFFLQRARVQLLQAIQADLISVCG